MPYIKKSDKLLLQTYFPSTAGELNYTLTMILKQYLFTKGESYQTYNDMMGVLEGAKLELYRRKISGYEDLAIEKNGDVY